jgi:N-acetylmuramoyl-L-alanine amidase
LLFVLASAAPAALASAGARPAAAPRPAAPATARIGGVSYTEARAWFARLGYQASFDADARALTLQAAAGQIVLTADSREASVHGLRIFLGEAPLLHKGALYAATIDLDRFLGPILRPAQLGRRPLRTIVLDPGHGGQDSGTRNAARKLDEKVFTLDVARRVQKLLAEADPSWRVLLTREDDRFVALPARAEFANRADADLFVSIHFNAVANNADVRGTETYVLTPRFQRSTSSAVRDPEDAVAQVGNRHDSRSAVLGALLHRQLLHSLKTEDRGYKRARFAVLRLVDCPSVLLEAGYLSNDAEARRIANPAFRGDIAEAIAAGIQAYAAALAESGQ